MLALTYFCMILLSSKTLALDGGMLYPRESESRQIQELNGMWNFRADFSPNRNAGFEEKWYEEKLSQTGPIIPMPVPSSYNDITTDKNLRDFVGWVWYDREFFVSSDWIKKRVVLRIDSAHYNSIVWINGKKVLEHEGGHLPFEGAVNDALDYNGVNILTVAVNNTLSPHTLPPGTLTFKSDTKRYPDGYFVQNLQFDFFNYAGIHRHVRLYTTPKTYVDDITITTDVTGASGTYTGVVKFNVTLKGEGKNKFASINIKDKNGTSVGKLSAMSGTITIKNAKLWWPYTLSLSYGYMYTMEVIIQSDDGKDVYRQPFGIRTIRNTEKQLFINDKQFYCHGVAKHEDSDIRGKGLDFPLIARDFNMLKWLGSNCFRTSHYPYAEEIMDQADQQGIVVIDECPAVGLQKKENFASETLEHHKEVMEELIRRDKNRPSVLIWSVANEPKSSLEEADSYFKEVIEHTRNIDPMKRWITFTMSVSYQSDRAGKYTDIQCINKYYAWYSDFGHTEVIQLQLKEDFDGAFQKLKKPLMISEYGADTIAGFHIEPSAMFTEDYQAQFLHQYHEMFDILRKDYLVGEMVWNFADFMTGQGTTRVVGNKKGVLTRQRQPKMGGHVLRERYWTIINETLSSIESKQVLSAKPSYIKLLKMYGSDNIYRHSSFQNL